MFPCVSFGLQKGDMRAARTFKSRVLLGRSKVLQTLSSERIKDCPKRDSLAPAFFFDFLSHHPLHRDAIYPEILTWPELMTVPCPWTYRNLSRTNLLPLPIQFPANATGTAVEGGLRVSVPTPTLMTQLEFMDSGFSQAYPSHCNHFENKPADRIFHQLPTLSWVVLSPSISAFQ